VYVKDKLDGKNTCAGDEYAVDFNCTISGLFPLKKLDVPKSSIENRMTKRFCSLEFGGRK
jgi:hypothetical protein